MGDLLKVYHKLGETKENKELIINKIKMLYSGNAFIPPEDEDNKFLKIQRYFDRVRKSANHCNETINEINSRLDTLQ